MTQKRFTVGPVKKRASELSSIAICMQVPLYIYLQIIYLESVPCLGTLSARCLSCGDSQHFGWHSHWSLKFEKYSINFSCLNKNSCELILKEIIVLVVRLPLTSEGKMIPKSVDRFSQLQSGCYCSNA